MMHYLFSISRGYQKSFLASYSCTDEDRKLKPYMAAFIQTLHFSQVLGALETVNISIPEYGFRYVTYLTPFALAWVKENSSNENVKTSIQTIEKHVATLAKVIIVAAAIVEVWHYNLTEGVFLTVFLFKQFETTSKWLDKAFQAIKSFEVIRNALFIPITFRAGSYLLTAFLIDRLCFTLFPIPPAATVEETIQKIDEEITALPTQISSTNKLMVDKTYLEKINLPNIFNVTCSPGILKGDEVELINTCFHSVFFEGQENEKGEFSELKKKIQTEWDSYQSLSVVKKLKNPNLVKIKLLFLSILQSDRQKLHSKLGVMPFESAFRAFGLPCGIALPVPFIYESIMGLVAKGLADHFLEPNYIMTRMAYAIAYGRITYRHIYELKKSSWKGDLADLEASIKEDCKKISEWVGKNPEEESDDYTLTVTVSSDPELEKIIFPLLTDLGFVQPKTF